MRSARFHRGVSHAVYRSRARGWLSSQWPINGQKRWDPGGRHERISAVHLDRTCAPVRWRARLAGGHPPRRVLAERGRGGAATTAPPRAAHRGVRKQSYYPAARRGSVVEEMFGVPIADPYRWLEDGRAARVRHWAEAQDRLFRTHCSDWRERRLWAASVEEMSSFGVSEPPTVRGSTAFTAEQRREDEQRRLLVVDAHGDRRVLVAPARLDPSGHAGLYARWPSREGDLVAVQLEVGGQPGSDIAVLGARTGEA